MITIRTIDKRDFFVPWNNEPQYEEVEWFAADGDRVLGCVLRDRVDGDYGYMVLTNADGGPFCAVEVEVSITKRVAMARMKAEMKIAVKQGAK